MYSFQYPKHRDHRLSIVRGSAVITSNLIITSNQIISGTPSQHLASCPVNVRLCHLRCFIGQLPMNYLSYQPPAKLSDWTCYLSADLWSFFIPTATGPSAELQGFFAFIICHMAGLQSCSISTVGLPANFKSYSISAAFHLVGTPPELFFLKFLILNNKNKQTEPNKNIRGRNWGTVPGIKQTERYKLN